MQKINEKEYEENRVEERIYGQQLPTVILFTEPNNPCCDTFRDSFNKMNFTDIDSLEVKAYEIDVKECPDLADEWHVCSTNKSLTSKSIVPVMIVCLNNKNLTDFSARRFVNHDFNEVTKYIHDYIQTSLGMFVIDGACAIKLGEIRHYLKEKYGEAYVESDSTDPYDIFDEIADFILYSVLGICGCGTPMNTIIAIRDYLSIIDERAKVNDTSAWNISYTKMKEKFGYQNPSDNPLFQFMAYTLDHLDIIEHGYNIDGAWLSILGEKCLYVLDLYIKREL